MSSYTRQHNTKWRRFNTMWLCDCCRCGAIKLVPRSDINHILYNDKVIFSNMGVTECIYLWYWESIMQSNHSGDDDHGRGASNSVWGSWLRYSRIYAMCRGSCVQWYTMDIGAIEGSNVGSTSQRFNRNHESSGIFYVLLHVATFIHHRTTVGKVKPRKWGLLYRLKTCNEDNITGADGSCNRHCDGTVWVLADIEIQCDSIDDWGRIEGDDYHSRRVSSFASACYYSLRSHVELIKLDSLWCQCYAIWWRTECC